MDRLSTTSSTVTLTTVQPGGVGTQRDRTPRRLLHFSDGVIEEYSTDEEEDCVYSQTAANVNPKTLPWLPWMWYYMQSAAVKTFSAADGCGERLAWLFGITSPKYQYALDEFHRQQLEEKEEKEREEREKEAIRERRSEGRSNISTVSQHTASLPFCTSDRNMLSGHPANPVLNIDNQSQAVSSISLNQSAASIHKSSHITGQSAVQIHEDNNQSHSNNDMSIFPA